MEDDLVYPHGTPDISDLDRLFAEMFREVQNGNIDGLKAIRKVEPGPFQEHLRMNGGLLLYEAVRMGVYCVGDFLLANGCSLQNCHRMTSSALHLAAYNLEAADFLDRLAMYSSQCLDVLDMKCNTPLHVASSRNNVRGVEALLTYGADVHKENINRECPLDLALAGGHVDCVRLLLNRYENYEDTQPASNNINSICNKVRSLLQMEIAAKSFFDVLGHKNVIEALALLHNWDRPRSKVILSYLTSLGINLTDDKLNAVKCRAECIDLLIQKNCKFNMLHLSLKFLSHGYYFNAMKSLVENYGISVNSVDSSFYTPLHIAVDRSEFDGVEYLLDHGAMVNTEWKIGITPLEMALQKRVVNDAIVRLLVERGAHVNFMRSNGWCPLKGALERHNEGLAQFLVDNGADIDLKNPATGMSIFFWFLFTPVSRQCNTKAMSFLLERGASLEYGESNATPLHIIASNQTSRDQGCVEFMKLLIKHSPIIDPVDVEGNTPLMKAIKVPFHSTPIIKLLLESGADPSRRNFLGQTALDLAITLHKVDVISLLMEHCVEYDPNTLFANKTVLLETLIINMPYSRGELFAMQGFLVRPDVIQQRTSFVVNFINANINLKSDFFEELFACLYEHLHQSSVEKSCMSRVTSGSSVLFSQVEYHVLKNKLSNRVNESLLRGVLEYRIVVNDGDSYVSACDREILSLEDLFLVNEIEFSFLFLPERRQVRILSTHSNVRKGLVRLVQDDSFGSNVLLQNCPIFGVTLMHIITGILATFHLTSAATLFLNRYVAQIRTCALGFKSLPQHIVDNILSYLAPDDLKNFMFLEKTVIPQTVDIIKKLWKNKLYEYMTSTDLLSLTTTYAAERTHRDSVDWSLLTFVD